MNKLKDNIQIKEDEEMEIDLLDLETVSSFV